MWLDWRILSDGRFERKGGGWVTRGEAPVSFWLGVAGFLALTLLLLGLASLPNPKLGKKGS